MITIRYFAIAFISNNGKLLMMNRNGRSKIATNLWAPVGGHIEDGEHNRPLDACKREIYEETGVQENEIANLELKYIVLRKRHNEIRIQYVYFGETMKTELIECDEGSLHWINKDLISGLDVTFTTQEIWKKHLENSNLDNKIQVGVVDENNEIPFMQWSGIEDWKNNEFI